VRGKVAQPPLGIDEARALLTGRPITCKLHS
jgi:hypothetical protein